MAIESGLGWTTFSVDDAAGTLRALRPDATQLSWATPRAVQDTTTLDKSANARLLLLADFTGTVTFLFDDAANAAFDVCKTIPSTSVARTMTIAVSGQTLTNEVVLTDFPWQRTQAGEFTAAVPFALADGTVPAWS